MAGHKEGGGGKGEKDAGVRYDEGTAPEQRKKSAAIAVCERSSIKTRRGMEQEREARRSNNSISGMVRREQDRGEERRDAT